MHVIRHLVSGLAPMLSQLRGPGRRNGPAAARARADARLLSRFGRDRRGAAAVEFCFVAPLLITLYLGVFEGSRFYEVGRKTNSAAETLGDLVARTKSVDIAGLKDVFAVSKAIITPFDTSKLSMQITAVEVDALGNGKVVWSRKSTDTVGLAKGAKYTVPETLKTGGDTFLLFVEVAYNYVSPLAKPIIGTNVNIKRKFAVVPRVAKTIPCSDCT